MLDVEIGNGSRTQTGTKQQGGTDVTGQLRIIVLDTPPTCSFSAWISLKWTVSKC
jgi:hypothetical protein